MKQCIPCLILLFFFSCQEQDLLIIEEISDHSPTIIETGKGSFSYSLDNEIVVESEGFGGTIAGVYYTIATSEVICTGPGSSEVTLASEEDAYVINFLGTSKDDMLGVRGVLRTTINGREEKIFLNKGCSLDTENIEVQIDSLSEAFVSGVFIANGYRRVEGDEDLCESYLYVGKVKIAFAVPLVNC